MLLGISDIVAEFLQSRNRKITEFVIHPDWNLTVRSWKADIAIGILEKMVKYNDFYGPICLNENPIDEFYDRQGIVTGWGSTNVNGSGYSEIGNEFRLTIVDDDVCQEKTRGLVDLAKGKSFCAGNISRSAACNGENEKKNSQLFLMIFPIAGDSGGTLVVTGSDSRYLAVGIVSVGFPDQKNNITCDVKNYQLYTDVAVYYSWIMTVLFDTY